MKQDLTAILGALAQVETKGDSTLILADCRRGLAGIIQTIPDTPQKSAAENEQQNNNEN